MDMLHFQKYLDNLMMTFSFIVRVVTDVEFHSEAGEFQ